MEQSYKEKYEQALSKAKDMLNYKEVRREDMEYLFPELAESEDEKVRKELIKHLKELSDWKEDEVIPVKNPSYYRQWASWLENVPVTIDHEKREGFHLGYKAGLEKQGEKLPAGFYYVNSEGKKFYSDTFKYGDVILHVEKQGEQKPEENKGNIGGISANWSVEDMSKVQRICKYLNEAKKYYADITEVRECIEWLKSLQDRVQPKPMCKFGDTELTQEELCEGLIRGMVNEHNRVTKEVLRTEYEKGRADAIAEMQKEWSDVDKDILFRIIDDLKFLRDTISIDPKYAVNIIDMEREITWLKSLRPQNTYNPYKAVVESIAEMCKHYDKASHSGLRDFYDNVKVKCKDAQEYDKMFPQNHWKPSDEQIGLLQAIINEPKNAASESCQIVLREVLEQLKKLKGEV